MRWYAPENLYHLTIFHTRLLVINGSLMNRLLYNPSQKNNGSHFLTN